MGTTLAHGGNTFEDNSAVGVVGLSDANNAAAEDGTHVTWVLLLGQGGHYLRATNHLFEVPLDAKIVGVQVGVKKGSTLANATTDLSVRLVKGGTVQGDEKGGATFWPTNPDWEFYGSLTDLWGLALTPADVNASNFGVSIAPNAALAATARVDYLTITIAYLGSNGCGALSGRMKTGDGMGVSDERGWL